MDELLLPKTGIMSNKARFIIDRAINQLTTILPLKNFVFKSFEYFHNIKIE